VGILTHKNKLFAALRRLSLPLACGIAGFFLTIFIDHIPHDNVPLFVLVFLTIVIVAHILWFHKIIQQLREELKISTQTSKFKISQASSPPIQQDEQKHDRLIEATLFQLLKDNLNTDYPPHIQANCLQDNKIHLIQTSGIIPLLKENHLEILAQPIVSLPQKRLSFFYCAPCVTLENGMVIDLNTMVVPSRYSTSVQPIEFMILFQSLQFIRRHHHSHPNYAFICALSPNLYQDKRCLEEITEFLMKSHFPFQSLIFEIPLEISETHFSSLLQFRRHGARFIGTWQNKDLPTDLVELPSPSVDFVMLSYSEVEVWLKKQPRRQSLISLNQILELSPQTIIVHVDKEQDLYQNLPVPFDFAAGNAFGLSKPLYHIQI
jgi:hypothetical protein